MPINCSLSHQGFTLLGRSSVAFTIFLIILYSNDFWFTYNAANLGILAILASLIITHFALLGLESKTACRWLAPLWKGKPAVVYRHWLRVDENTITFGIYSLLWSAIDSVSVSPFGNLVFRSTALSGPSKEGQTSEIDLINTVLKVPFAAIDLQAQKEFIALLKQKCPEAKLGASLLSVMDKPDLNSIKYIHYFTLIIFFAILTDVGYSTFSYVELLKRYYLSDKSALEGSLPESQKYYDSAEQLRLHPPLFSIISPKLLQDSTAAAGIAESRSKALWSLGNKTESLSAQSEAVKLAPKSFKITLRQARLYAALGKTSEGKEAIERLIKVHEHSLIPRLYLACLFLQENENQKARATLEKYFTFLCKGDGDKTPYFTPPPVWPPVGEEVLHEIFCRQDLDFLLNTALNSSR